MCDAPFSSSQGEEKAMLWEREEARPRELAACSRAVAATTNRCGWESSDKRSPPLLPAQVTVARSSACCGAKRGYATKTLRWELKPMFPVRDWFLDQLKQ